jgi:hypothetical protein
MVDETGKRRKGNKRKGLGILKEQRRSAPVEGREEEEPPVDEGRSTSGYMSRAHSQLDSLREAGTM